MSELTHGEFDQRPDGWNMVDLTPPATGALTREQVEYWRDCPSCRTLRATISQQAQELERVKIDWKHIVYKRDQLSLENSKLTEQLAASQARCRELEEQIQSWQLGKRVTDAATQIREDQIAQLQATLAAREAVIHTQAEEAAKAAKAYVQESGRLRAAALWAMKKVQRLSTRAVDYKRAADFIEHEKALKGA